MYETTEQQLERVQKRIAEIEDSVKEYAIANRKIVNHELNVLYKREAELKARLQDESGGGFTFAQIGTL